MTRKRDDGAQQHSRLAEIVDVLRRNEIVRGLTPEKLCTILEELGPTFIKLGQVFSMRTDFLPEEYCTALAKLRTSVTPMPWEQVERILTNAYGRPAEEVFASFSREPLGSASIAQVHEAVLPEGQRVVVKVQREGIHAVMNRDIHLLKKAAELVKYTPARDLVDFNQVLDQLWTVAQQEMDFLTEAENLERFARLNASVTNVGAPRLYRQYTTAQVLVMENVEGIQIDRREELIAAGYDLRELGERLADHYIKQVTEDGFFHADPHPGNLRVRDGKLIFLDMGMMGTLGPGIRSTLMKAVEGIARGDAGSCADAVMALGEARGETDRRKLYRACEEMLNRYGSMDLAQINLSRMLGDMMEIMKENRIAMPSELSMLARGLATLEGVVMQLAPETNVMQIAAARVRRSFFRHLDVQGEVDRGTRAVYESTRKSLDIPALLADLLRTGIRGDAGVNVEYRTDNHTGDLIRESIGRLCMALICGALLLAAAMPGGGQAVLGELTWFRLGCLAAGLALGAACLLPRRRK